jgi:hypothetical protein
MGNLETPRFNRAHRFPALLKSYEESGKLPGLTGYTARVSRTSKIIWGIWKLPGLTGHTGFLHFKNHMGNLKTPRFNRVHGFQTLLKSYGESGNSQV